jgi:hypothetical protein
MRYLFFGEFSKEFAGEGKDVFQASGFAFFGAFSAFVFIF